MRTLPLSVVAALVSFGLGRGYGILSKGSPSASSPEVPAISSPSLPPVSVPAGPATGMATSLTDSPAGSERIASAKPNQTLNERLSALYKHDDPFGSAARIQAFIPTLTAEDFHWLATEARELPTHTIKLSNPDLSKAVMDALVDRWLKADPEGALSGIRQLHKRFDQAYDYSLPLYALARIRPEVLLDDLPEGATWSVFDLTIQTAFSSLGERDPGAARRYLERCRLPDQRKQAEEGIALGVAKRNPMTAVKLAVDLDSPQVLVAALKSADRIGEGMLAQVLDAADGRVKLREPFIDAELMMRYPDLPWAANTAQALENVGISNTGWEAAATLTPEERDRVLANADQLPAGFAESTISAILNTWASQEPQRAIDWALKYAVPDDGSHARNSPLGMAFTSFVRSDSAAAVGWWSRLPPSPLKQSLGNRAAMALVQEGKLDQALALFQPLGHHGSMLAAELAMAQSNSNQDPAQVAAWIDALPSQVRIGEAVSVVLRQWLVQDPGKAAQWVESQPEGSRRDEALTAFAAETARHDPKIAEDWAATITNPVSKQSAVRTIYHELSRRDPVAARNWLRALTGIDEEWRERLLRRR